MSQGRADLITTKPIFVVGSPRSGTSVLTWCLGQHSDIFLQEESDWLGPLVYQLAIAYRIGTARGERSQLSALGVERAEFFECFGRTINALILGHRKKMEVMIVQRRRENPSRPVQTKLPGAYRISRSAADPKQRWVDGTPEYSLYIDALRKLFPDALFIHVVRNVDEVVRPLLNFHRTGGSGIVANEEEAYRYWLRRVGTCFAAERAYGSEVMRRVSYAQLVANPESTLASLLAFLGESYEPSCLDPLRSRINSSEVPANFDPSDARTDPAVVAQARSLEGEIATAPLAISPSRMRWLHSSNPFATAPTISARWSPPTIAARNASLNSSNRSRLPKRDLYPAAIDSFKFIRARLTRKQSGVASITCDICRRHRPRRRSRL